jgi:hypothetical protein
LRADPRRLRVVGSPEFDAPRLRRRENSTPLSINCAMNTSTPERRSRPEKKSIDDEIVEKAREEY